MKYKTLFRLLIKAVGVYCIIQGSGLFIVYLGWVIAFLVDGGGNGFAQLFSVVGSFGEVVAGLYLFFGGQWVVDQAIPGNRPYCHECGYDLTGAVRNRCPECDTPFDPELVQPAQTQAAESVPSND